MVPDFSAIAIRQAILSTHFSESIIFQKTSMIAYDASKDSEYPIKSDLYVDGIPLFVGRN